MVSVLALVEDMVLCGVLTEAITYSVAARFERARVHEQLWHVCEMRCNGFILVSVEGMMLVVS